MQANVQKIEGERVTLLLSDGQTLKVSLVDLEGIPKLGSNIRLILVVPGSEDAGRQHLAREVLNEILSP